MDESRTPASGTVRYAGIRKQQTDETVRLLRSRDGHIRSECSLEQIRCYSQLTGDTLGPVRIPSLPRVPVGHSGRQRDHGTGSAGETEGGETTRIQRRVVEDC